MATTFKATTKKDLKLGDKPFSKIEKHYQPFQANVLGSAAITGLVGGREPEAWGAQISGTLIGPKVSTRKMGDEEYAENTGMNPFLAAAHLAFDYHWPLTISPDDVWLCIAQGFAAHVKANAEALRHRFVKHEGQAIIEVRRDNFAKGSPANDWEGAFAEFSDKIAEHIGNHTRNLVVSDFSTTGAIERASSEIVLMDAMSPYFKYLIKTCCGIPEVTLLGSVEDWKSVRARAAVFGEYDLGWWTNHLLPILDKIIESAAGKSDPAFWESFYHKGGGSGGPYVTGWINVLFPYLGGRKMGRNEYVSKWEKGIGCMCGGPSPESFPAGLSKVAFEWLYYDDIFPMEFLGGFIGVSQDEASLCMRPVIGWAVRDREENQG